jgi:glycerol-3-phosphate O-acyltransferase / dihydroxyacetone phosphate acyltransferase
MFYRLFKVLAGVALRLFFRRIEIEGLEQVPATGPLLLLSNHTNALVDPLLPLIALRRRVTLTAKNVLARNPLLRVLGKGLGAVFFHRSEDAGKGADPRENVRSLRQCRQILADGGAIIVFPEGMSHSDLTMRRFHTGFARMAIDFVHKDGNPGRLHLVPVGLLYTSKDRFRSDVWLRFGAPLDVGGWLEAHADPSAGVLTEELRHRVQSQTMAFENRSEMLIVRYAGEIIATDGRMPQPLGGANPPLAESFGRLARLQEGYRRARADSADEVQALADRIRLYRTELKRLGIEPAEVYLPLHAARAALFLIRELELVVVGAPLAIFGIVNHFLPYLIVRTIARTLSTEKDHWATNVIYPGLIVFPLYELLLVAAIWILLPTLWAAIYTVALPYTGYYALLYGERAGSAWRRANTFLYFLFNRDTQSRLVDEGRSILSAVYALGDRLETPQPGPGASASDGL